MIHLGEMNYGDGIKPTRWVINHNTEISSSEATRMVDDD